MMKNPFVLNNKTILVTGASSGIGRSVACECAGMGARVVITGRNEERLSDTFNSLEGDGHLKIVADLTCEEDVTRLVEETPIVDGVVHCAGVNSRKLLNMVKEEDIDFIMDNNFKSPVLLQRALLKKKKINKGSSIVFIASRAPFAPAAGNGIYAASKGALIAYSKVLGLELSSKKIRVNCVCPGVVKTEMSKRDEEALGVDYSVLEQSYPLKRFGEPEDIANLSVFLLSDASSWMTGSVIDITGGGEFTLK